MSDTQPSKFTRGCAMTYGLGCLTVGLILAAIVLVALVSN